MSEPRDGWYVATDALGQQACIRWTGKMLPDGKGWWNFSSMPHQLPEGWTLGPRIDDLARDAARYHESKKAQDLIREAWTLLEGQPLEKYKRDAGRYLWLRSCRSYPFGSTDWDDVDALIDAEIAREKADG